METPRYTPNDIQHLPSLPGIYLFYNQKEEVIYVGKAKNIKKEWVIILPLARYIT